MHEPRQRDTRRAASHPWRLAKAALFIGVTIGAISPSPGRAEDLTFNLKNCHATPIDVQVYNEGDGIQMFTSSAWYDMQTGQTIGFKCSKVPNRVEKCQVKIKTKGDGAKMGIYHLEAGPQVQCFNFHEDWGQLTSGCRC